MAAASDNAHLLVKKRGVGKGRGGCQAYVKEIESDTCIKARREEKA